MSLSKPKLGTKNEPISISTNISPPPTTAASTKKTGLKKEHVTRRFTSVRTEQPAEYRVVSIEPPLDELHRPPQTRPHAVLPLDCTSVINLALTRPAQLGPSFGTDTEHITVKVKPVSSTCLGVEIQPRDKQAWKVPEHVVVRHSSVSHESGSTTHVTPHRYEFVWDDPERFGFKVLHADTNETIFDTTNLGIIIQDQYLEISTRLGGGKDLGATRQQHQGGKGAYIYGLGENVGRFRRPPGSVSTMWARDCPCKPEHNLYGCHPFYMEVLPGSGTAHGVLLLSSSGMDISLSETGDMVTYKVIGGFFEFYFFSGPTPEDVIRQYTALIGRPLLVPYWSLGNHQCRWGYNTLDKVKEVVNGFQKSRIPLEAIWIDIDYMDEYKCFTLDSKRFPATELAAFSKQLHVQDQHLVMMLDPGIKLQYQKGVYKPYDEGVDCNLFIKRRIKEVEEKEDNTKYRAGDLVDFVGKVWPGLTVFPDWFHPASQDYWTKYILEWIKQVQLDGIWIDMNEIASFHDGDASHVGASEDRPVQLSDFEPAEPDEDNEDRMPLVQPQHATTSSKEEVGTGSQDDKNGTLDEDERPHEAIAEHEEEYEAAHDPKSRERRLSCVAMESRQARACGVVAQPQDVAHERIEDARPPIVYADVNRPPYRINNNNEQADLEYRTVSADALHHDGVLEYDAHNLYGHMESIATYNAMRKLYPNKKPFVLSRSTFVGTGKYACHWLGDNWSRWYDIRMSIAGFLNFQFFGIPMVGSDVGGFGDNADEELLIRWHQLGAFYPFMRNHNCIVNVPQEPYLTPLLAQVTRHYLELRYRLLPYWYTLFQKAHHFGDLVCAPIWTLSPDDVTLLDVDEQFLVGNALLVSPVLYEKHTTVTATFPPGLWYNLETGIVEVSAPQQQRQQHSLVKQHVIVKLKAPLESMPVHVRGGSIVPMCGLLRDAFLATTRQVREAGLQLLVALDVNGMAHGEVVHDDDSFEVKEATRVVMEMVAPGMLRIDCKPFHLRKVAKPTLIRSIVIWGLGLDQFKLSLGQGGLIPSSLQGSHAQVDIKQVRLSRVEPVVAAGMSPQHQRKLAAVDPTDLEILWDGCRAQLTVHIKGDEQEGGRGGGVLLRGGEGLELDWTQALNTALTVLGRRK